MNQWIQIGGLVTMLSVAIGPSAARADEKQVPKCPVMDEPVNLAVSTATDDGPVFFCCKGCVRKFKAAPDKYATALVKQRQVLAKREKIQVRCPVTGEPVDSKVVTEHAGRTIHFCCKECIIKFRGDPSRYEAALANSYTYQTQCPVMGERINPKASAVLPTGETIYYCCMGCHKKLLDDPAKYATVLAKQGMTIDAAKIKEATGG